MIRTKQAYLKKGLIEYPTNTHDLGRFCHPLFRPSEVERILTCVSLVRVIAEVDMDCLVSPARQCALMMRLLVCRAVLADGFLLLVKGMFLSQKCFAK